MAVPVYEMNQFMWSNQSRVFHAEASSLARLPNSPFGQISSIASGLKIRSYHTGKVMTFAITHVERDADQDIIEWVLESADTDVRVVIYND